MTQIDSEKKFDRLKLSKLLKAIYKDHTTEEIKCICNQLLQILDNFSQKSRYEEISEDKKWDESYSVLITYADGVYKKGEVTLVTLRKLLSNHFGIKPIQINLIWSKSCPNLFYSFICIDLRKKR